MGRKVVIAIFLLAAARMVWPPFQAVAQNQAAQPAGKLSFDVVFIHEWKPGQPSGPYAAGLQLMPDRIVARCADLNSLLYFAYHLSFQSPIDGKPSWANAGCGDGDNTYEIGATMPMGTTDEQMREMMQTLLAERFKLAVHWQKKALPAYALVVAPGGFKLKPSDPKDEPPRKPGSIDCSAKNGCRGVAMGTGPVSGLAELLGGTLGRQVIDKTGLAGTYYFNFLSWADDPEVDSTLPSLPTALRQQYGLELKPETAPVDVLVIDHVEKPTPN